MDSVTAFHTHASAEITPGHSATSASISISPCNYERHQCPSTSSSSARLKQRRRRSTDPTKRYSMLLLTDVSAPRNAGKQCSKTATNCTTTQSTDNEVQLLPRTVCAQKHWQQRRRFKVPEKNTQGVQNNATKNNYSVAHYTINSGSVTDPKSDLKDTCTTKHQLSTPKTYYNSRLNPIRHRQVKPPAVMGLYQIPELPASPVQCEQTIKQQKHIAHQSKPQTQNQEHDQEQTGGRRYFQDRQDANPEKATPIAYPPRTDSLGISTPKANIGRGKLLPDDALESFYRSKSLHNSAAAASTNVQLPTYRPSTSSAALGSGTMIQPQGERPRTVGTRAKSQNGVNTGHKRAHGPNYREWREVHVKSLGRVDLILREAAGLGRTNSLSVHYHNYSNEAEEKMAALSRLDSSPIPSTSNAHDTDSSLSSSPLARSRLRPSTCSGSSSITVVSTLSKAMAHSSTSETLQLSSNSMALRDSINAPNSRPWTSCHTKWQNSRDGSDSWCADSSEPANITTRKIQHRTMALGGQLDLLHPTYRNTRRALTMYNPKLKRLLSPQDEARRTRLFEEYENLISHDDEEDDSDGETNDCEGNEGAEKEYRGNIGDSTHCNYDNASDTTSIGVETPDKSTANNAGKINNWECSSSESVGVVKKDTICDDPGSQFQRDDRSDNAPPQILSRSNNADENNDIAGYTNIATVDKKTLPNPTRRPIIMTATNVKDKTTSVVGSSTMNPTFQISYPKRPATVHIPSPLSPFGYTTQQYGRTYKDSQKNIFSRVNTEQRWSRIILENKYLFSPNFVASRTQTGTTTGPSTNESATKPRPSVVETKASPTALNAESSPITPNEEVDTPSSVKQQQQQQKKKDPQQEHNTTLQALQSQGPKVIPVTRAPTLELKPTDDFYEDMNNALFLHLLSSTSSSQPNREVAGSLSNMTTRDNYDLTTGSQQGNMVQNSDIKNTSAQGRSAGTSLIGAIVDDAIYCLTDFERNSNACIQPCNNSAKSSSRLTGAGAQDTSNSECNTWRGTTTNTCVDTNMCGSTPDDSGVEDSANECTSGNVSTGKVEDEKNTTVKPQPDSQQNKEIQQHLEHVRNMVPAMEFGTVLAQNGQKSQELLEAYMEGFEFNEQPIDFALRQLLREFHLPKESQQIDRVILSFAVRYHECNPGLFYSADIVYSYAFAILLLHTDAHNPRVKQKMTKVQFVRSAKMLDERKQGETSEMFDEVLDILYDNITVVKFEYAPSTEGELSTNVEMAMMVRPATTGAIDSSSKDATAAQSITSWLRRMFLPVSAGSSPSKPALDSSDIPVKGQYSYTPQSSSSTRRHASSTSAGTPSNTFASTVFPLLVGNDESPSSDCIVHTDDRTLTPAIASSTAAQLSSPARTLNSPTVDSLAPASTELGAAPDSTLSPGLTSNTRRAMANIVALTPRFEEPKPQDEDEPRSTEDIQTKQKLQNTLIALSGNDLSAHSSEKQQKHQRSDSGDRQESRPMMLESVRLSSVKNHVKRRASLRCGRPLSGLIYETNRTADRLLPPAMARNTTAPATNSRRAFLRIDMAGKVVRKMDRLGNGRRGLMRRWKEIWMVLSGSRLYFFRYSSAEHNSDDKSGQPIQTIVPLRHGVAIVDSSYKKYPNVFRILAGDGSQILVKAPNSEAVEEWMAHINCASAFKTMDIERRTEDSEPGERAHQLENRIHALDRRLVIVDDKLERNLRLFKQLATLVPLTRHARTSIISYARVARENLKEMYLLERRLTCYRDILELDLAIEYEINSSHLNKD